MRSSKLRVQVEEARIPSWETDSESGPVRNEGARMRAHLLLLLGDLNAHLLLHEEARDTLVALARIAVGEHLCTRDFVSIARRRVRGVKTHEEDLSLGRVGDPHLRSGESVVGSIGGLDRGGLEGERIRSRGRLREAEGTELRGEREIRTASF